jgi:hypothetical protein
LDATTTGRGRRVLVIVLPFFFVVRERELLLLLGLFLLAKLFDCILLFSNDVFVCLFGRKEGRKRERERVSEIKFALNDKGKEREKRERKKE